ncbi:hypothetical protein TNCV_2787741 [Trichonephila clavipes]|uniref:Uncharacterized protein n=1 Tax=Trichonephila clavipes TaxID=2585209 RepID=A0A8X6SS48_TRICX|nr:hypothetical protein TNCV_2787741 [Trichonephila clavipes]
MRGLPTRLLFRVASCREGTIHLQTAIPSPGLEPRPYHPAGDTPEIMDEILTTARDLELEVNEEDIEELIMGHEDELTIEERQETQRNVSPSEQEEDKKRKNADICH